MNQGIELAIESEHRETTWTGAQHIVVRLTGAVFAVPLTVVQEVERIPTIVPIPHTPAWICGIVNLRGTILTVVDIAQLLGLGQWHLGPDARMLVIRGDEPVAVGVDSLDGMRQLPESAASTIDGTLAGTAAGYVSAVYRTDTDLLSVLDIVRLLNDNEDTNDHMVMQRNPSAADSHRVPVERGM